MRIYIHADRPPDRHADAQRRRLTERQSCIIAYRYDLLHLATSLGIIVFIIGANLLECVCCSDTTTGVAAVQSCCQIEFALARRFPTDLWIPLVATTRRFSFSCPTCPRLPPPRPVIPLPSSDCSIRNHRSSLHFLTSPRMHRVRAMDR